MKISTSSIDETLPPPEHIFEAPVHQDTETSGTSDETPPDTVLQGRIAPPSTPHAPRGITSSPSFSEMFRTDDKGEQMKFSDALLEEESVDDKSFVESDGFEAKGDIEGTESPVDDEDKVDALDLPVDSSMAEPMGSHVADIEVQNLAKDNKDDDSNPTTVAAPNIIDPPTTELSTTKAAEVDQELETSDIPQGNIDESIRSPATDETHPLSDPPNFATPDVLITVPEPVKQNQSMEGTTPVPSASHSLAIPSPTTTSERTYLTAAKEMIRPATSYSWLGALFQPIDPKLVDAQKTGWVEVSTTVTNAPPVRKGSTKLKKKKDDQVSVRHSISDGQGLKIARMWNYVMESIFWSWSSKVVDWFRGEKRKTA
jgi:hypothetical protein